jgi:hypothetical protein
VSVKHELNDIDWEPYVMAAIRAGNRHARHIRLAVRVMLRGRVIDVPGEPSDGHVYRPVDRAIQNLRKAGKIAFGGLKDGWRLA